MNRDRLFQALSGLDDRYVAEAIRYAPGDASGASERIVKMKAKRIITIALAAVLILALGITGYAVNAALATPEAAEKVALEQIEEWKALGLISQDVVFEGPAADIFENEEVQGGSYWYNRLFPHNYQVQWYGDGEYACNLEVDTQTGKITLASITAYPREGDAPEDEIVDSDGDVLGYYGIFDYIIPADMTVDRFCTLLAEYWGFSGYRIADIGYDEYLHASLPAVDGSTLLTDTSSREGHYLTVFFEGDQEGAPMYIELDQFPNHVVLSVGTNHGVG